MRKSKTVNVIAIPQIEFAATLVCEKHGPGLFDAGGPNQAFWFIDEPGVRASIKKIENNQLTVDPEQYRSELKHLEEFI